MALNLQHLLLGTVLAVPVAVSLTLIALLASRRKRKRNAICNAVGAASQDQVVAGKCIENEVQKQMPVALVDFTARRVEIQRDLEMAQGRGEKKAVASLFLELANAEAALGDEPAQLAALRSAAGLATLHGVPGVHAAARLQLAEIATRAGDMTTACEHWQLARIAFLDDGKTDKAASVDKRMHENGCPTDWVLTDF